MESASHELPYTDSTVLYCSQLELTVVCYLVHRNPIMAFVTHRTHQKRKGHCRTIFAHISRHHCTEAAHRRGRGQRPEQVRPSGQVRDQEQVGARSTVLVAPSHHQNRDHQTVESRTCKSSIIISSIGQ